MADLERGQRIKARREELHLTQPAVVELLEKAAFALPEDHPLHPEKAGKPPVTLRGLQTWEGGGGVAWEKAKLLALVLQTDVTSLINGVPSETPDPFPETIDDRLDRMERRIMDLLEQQNELLARQSMILEKIEAAMDEESVATRVDAAIAQVVRERGGTALEAAPRPPARARAKTAK